MTPNQINQRVQKEADARLGETVEKLLFTLLHRHTHQCWHKECSCEYCRFINGDYIEAKLYLHKIKKYLRKYDHIWHLTEDEMCGMMSVEMLLDRQKRVVRFLKQHKQSLKKNVI